MSNLFDTLAGWRNDPILAYSSWLQDKNYADSTKIVYLSMFVRFCEWLSTRRKVFSECTKEDIEAFLNSANPNLPETRRRPQNGRQRQQYVRQLERVFVHLGILGYTGKNPGQQAGWEKVGKGKDKPTRFLNFTETKAVIDIVTAELEKLKREEKGIEDWTAYRDLALVAVTLGAGLKVSHIERLTLNCIEIGEVRIDLSLSSHAHRARILPFALEPLQAWLSIQKQLHAGKVTGNTLIFEGDHTVGFGRNSKSPIMHASSIHRRTQRILANAGVTGERASAQTLRNTYAAQLIESGASDNELVDFLGLKATYTAIRLRRSFNVQKGT